MHPQAGRKLGKYDKANKFNLKQKVENFEHKLHESKICNKIAEGDIRSLEAGQNKGKWAP